MLTPDRHPSSAPAALRDAPGLQALTGGVERRRAGLAAGCGLALALAAATSGIAHAETVAGAEIRVVDGDTVMVHGERIRLLEPDAPEISKPRCQNELIQGLHAADRLRALLSGPVEIRRGANSDRYGRTLASLVVGAGNVAEILIAEKLALPYRPGPAAYDDRRRHWCPSSERKQTP